MLLRKFLIVDHTGISTVVCGIPLTNIHAVLSFSLQHNLYMFCAILITYQAVLYAGNM